MYSAAFFMKLTPLLRPVPMAPTTPVFFAHSRPLWTFSPSQCEVPAALCFAQSTALPAFRLAQSKVAPALCCTQLAPVCRAVKPPRATSESACPPFLMCPHALWPNCFVLPQAFWPDSLAAFQRPCALLEMELLAEWKASPTLCPASPTAPATRLVTARTFFPTLPAAPTPRRTTLRMPSIASPPKRAAVLAKLLMPPRTVSAVALAKLLTALVALFTVWETELMALETWLETKCPRLPRPQRCGWWPPLIR